MVHVIGHRTWVATSDQSELRTDRARPTGLGAQLHERLIPFGDWPPGRAFMLEQVEAMASRLEAFAIRWTSFTCLDETGLPPSVF